MILRTYQQQGVNDIRNSYRNGSNAPLYVLPTGGGKTFVFSYIAKNSSLKGKRVLILVHRIELLRQTINALTLQGVDHGVINPKYTPAYFEKVQVASVQTLIRRLHKLPAPDLIVIDEAHHATAGSWKTIMAAYPAAKLLGVTATPIRGDGTGLDNIFDSLIIGPQVHELIDLGYLVKPVIYAPSHQLDLSGVRTKLGDYDKDQITDIVDKAEITGSAVEHYQKICPGAPAVAFCISVAHAEHVAAQFRAAGIVAASVDGSMDDTTRTAILNGLGKGIDLVASCDLISEGTDIPAIGCAILLRPTKSQGLFIQQVGRALRPSAGKDRAVILDHVGNVLRHGFPDEEREWSLAGIDKKKRKKQEEEAPLRVKQCPSCYAMHEPKPACPYCGHVYEVQGRKVDEKEGELREITAEDRAKMKRKEVGRARDYEALVRIEKERGYKPGWARHVYQARMKKVAVSAG